MLSLLLAFALQSPAGLNSAASWDGYQCTATDYQGVYTTGYGVTKAEAEDRALQTCQARSRGFCVSTGCLPAKF